MPQFQFVINTTVLQAKFIQAQEIYTVHIAPSLANLMTSAKPAVMQMNEKAIELVKVVQGMVNLLKWFLLS